MDTTKVPGGDACDVGHHPGGRRSPVPTPESGRGRQPDAGRKIRGGLSRLLLGDVGPTPNRDRPAGSTQLAAAGTTHHADNPDEGR